MNTLKLLAVTIVLCFASTADAGTSETSPKRPMRKAKVNIEASESATPQAKASYHAMVKIGGALGGPVVYDRLALTNGSGEMVRDPALVSSMAGVEIMQDFAGGSTFLFGYARMFQPVSNSSEGRYSKSDEQQNSGTEPDVREETEIRARGYGLLIGWQFRTPTSRASLYPRVGIGYEEDALSVRGKHSGNIDGVSTDEDIGIEGKMQLVTGLMGVRWVWMTMPTLVGVDFDLYGPINGQKVISTLNNSTSATLSQDLHFGSRLGGAISIFFGI